jgi:DNA-binding CsgD family transcriptional regulator
VKRGSSWIRTERARRIIQIGREASEIADQAARRQHLANRVRQLVGAALVFVATDDDVGPGARGNLVAAAVDNFDARVQPAFDTLCERGCAYNPAIERMQAASLNLHVGEVTALGLDKLLGAKAWRRSEFYQQFMRPAGVDHGLYGAMRIDQSSCDVLACWRETTDRPFDEEQQAEIELLMLEFGHLWRRPTRAEAWPGRLPPRYRRTFDLLLTSRSEKQIAAELGLTAASLHEYVKALYRLLGVSSRAELLVRALKRGELA